MSRQEIPEIPAHGAKLLQTRRGVEEKALDNSNLAGPKPSKPPEALKPPQAPKTSKS